MLNAPKKLVCTKYSGQFIPWIPQRPFCKLQVHGKERLHQTSCKPENPTIRLMIKKTINFLIKVSNYKLQIKNKNKKYRFYGHVAHGRTKFCQSVKHLLIGLPLICSRLQAFILLQYCKVKNSTLNMIFSVIWYFSFIINYCSFYDDVFLWITEQILSWMLDEFVYWPKIPPSLISNLWWNNVMGDWKTLGRWQ